MLRKLIRVNLMAMFGMVAMMLAYGAATASPQDKDKKDEVPDIKEIMSKGHKGSDAYITKIKDAVKGEKWEDAQKYAKTLAFFGEALGKNKAPKGDADSWKTLCEKYAAATKAAYKGTEDKDAKAVAKGLGAINCGECHKLHKK
ncbi:MAG: hypothetical protein K8U57_26990 [Planctomycetes bacterium]|nr:hypothetical protein [Planctomycetota bacterium]